MRSIVAASSPMAASFSRCAVPPAIKQAELSLCTDPSPFSRIVLVSGPFDFANCVSSI